MANLTRRIPFFSMLSRFSLYHDDDRFRGFWMRAAPHATEAIPEIRIDHLSVNDDGYTIRAEISGAKKEDVRVQVDGKRVSISAEVRRDREERSGDKIMCAECFRGSSYRSFTLDDDVDEEKAEARYDNGVLELTLPRKSCAAGRQLQIK